MNRLWIILRFAVFIPFAPLIVAGTLLAMLLAPGYWLNPSKAPGIGLRWLRNWWKWVSGEITTWELIK